MSWHKITLTADQVSSGLMIKIQEEFSNLYIASLAPDGAALFSPSFPQGSSDELTEFYFSPASMPFARVLVARYSGVPCRKPLWGGITLLVGKQDSWDLLR